MSQGEGGGRPEKYTPEFIENEAIELLKWIEQEGNLFTMKFALSRGYSPQRFTEWTQINQKFSEAFARAKSFQEVKLMEGGLYGVHKEQMSKFCLINHHDYKEKSQIDQKIDGSLSISTVDYSKAE